MKKLILFIITIILNAQNFILQNGWNLKGTSNFISLKYFNNKKIEAIWSYNNSNKKWQAFFPNKSIDLQKYNIEKLKDIKKNKGFWIRTNQFTLISTTHSIFNQFNVGFGGAAFKFHNNIWMDVNDLIDANFSNYQNRITDFNLTAFKKVSKYVKNAKFIDIWITQNWQKEWYNLDSIQKLINKGKIPVFIYFYFGDHLNSKYLKEHKDEYFENVKKVANYFSKLKGTIFFIFEPEFNKKSITDNPDEFIDTISQAIDILKSKIPNSLISLCMMDTGVRDVNSPKKCGYENCALGDKDEWNRSIPIFKALNYKLDFISFQEMIGQFSRNPLNPGTWNNPNPIAYTDEELGINYIGKRVDNLAKFLIENLKKPVFLAYTSIATATWKDLNKDGKIQDNEINPLGWLDEAKSGYSQIKNCKNIFGFSIMNLFDNPTHDNGGWQFFLQNEYHLGIITGKILDNQLTGDIKEKDHLLELIFSK